MGNFTGRTQSGKVFAVIRTLFSRYQPNSKPFTKEELSNMLLKIYQHYYPDDGVNDPTGLYDGVRCLADLDNTPIKREKKGIYWYIREFSSNDYSKFQKNYYKYSAKGKKYRNQNKESSSMKNNGITQLGDHNTQYQYDNPNPELLEVFENSKPERDYEVTYTFNEFTSLCPKTGQPDFATVYVEYIPGEYCIETKSLKIYFLAFRQYGSFMETITNKILDDLIKVCDPRYMKITCRFNARGGTFIDVVAEKPKKTPTLSA